MLELGTIDIRGDILETLFVKEFWRFISHKIVGVWGSMSLLHNSCFQQQSTTIILTDGNL